VVEWLPSKCEALNSSLQRKENKLLCPFNFSKALAFEKKNTTLIELFFPFPLE
jgi:hypothetical protein